MLGNIPGTNQIGSIGFDKPLTMLNGMPHQHNASILDIPLVL